MKGQRNSPSTPRQIRVFLLEGHKLLSELAYGFDEESFHRRDVVFLLEQFDKASTSFCNGVTSRVVEIMRFPAFAASNAFHSSDRYGSFCRIRRGFQNDKGHRVAVRGTQSVTHIAVKRSLCNGASIM